MRRDAGHVQHHDPLVTEPIEKPFPITAQHLAPVTSGHLGEGRVHCHLEAARTQGARQPPGHMHPAGKEDHARVGRPPEDGRVLAVPGKNTAAVRRQKPFRAEIPAHGEQAVGAAARRVTRGSYRERGWAGGQAETIYRADRYWFESVVSREGR